jgi:flagellin
MGLRVATNIQSLAAQRHLAINNESQKANLEKLSSGTRIVRAADDSAGLAISEKMKAQVRSIRQDVRNANDGISMIQTAEGGMNEIGNILTRFRELSIQSASDTITDAERNFIDKEVQQLKSEVDRIAGGTEYNGTKLLAGAEGTSSGDGVLEIQVGQQNNPDLDRFRYDLAKSKTTSEGLGIHELSVATKVGAQENLANIDNAIKKLSENRSELGALQNRLQSGINNLNIYDENLSAARSRIYDVDVASATADLTKYNILSQAGTAVLSQANQNAVSALKLL